MATSFDKKVNVSAAITPTTPDTPTDIRTRIETLADMTTIPLAYVGMEVYVIDTGKKYKVLTLSNRTIGTVSVPYYPATWEEASSGKKYQAGEYGIKDIDNTADEPEINVNFGDDQNEIIDTIFGSDDGSSSETILDPTKATGNYTPTGIYAYPSTDATSEAYKTAAGYGIVYLGIETIDGKPAVRAAVVGGSVDPSPLFAAGTTIGAVYVITDNGQEQGTLTWKQGNAFFATFIDATEIISAVVEVYPSSSTLIHDWLYTNAGNKKVSIKVANS